MKTLLRRTALAVLILAAVAATAVGAGLVLGTQKAARQIALAVAPVVVPTDAASLERGRYLYTTRGCGDCHGADGGGRTLVDDGSVHIAGPDITSGGSTARYTEVDWVRAVRHGVGPDRRPLRVMPSEDYNRLTDADLGAIVAHVRSLPPRNNAKAVVELPLVARVMYGLGLIDDAAGRIDHSLPPSTPVPEGPTVEHGRYVAQMCIGCHGPGYSGGKIPGAPPDWPAAANLTPGEGGTMSRYPDAAAFAAMMKSGKRPDGSRIGLMPFEALSKMNDADLNGLYAYLRTLPARPAGGR